MNGWRKMMEKKSTQLNDKCKILANKAWDVIERGVNNEGLTQNEFMDIISTLVVRALMGIDTEEFKFLLMETIDFHWREKAWKRN
jgi:hypothetical protein